MAKTKSVALYEPRRVIVDYKQGLEKQISESIMNEIHELVKSLGWVKSNVSYRIFKVEKHPKLEPGYIYEVHLEGDGHSYIESLLDSFEDSDVRHVWINSTRGNSNFIEIKNGVVETNWIDSHPEEETLQLPLEGRKKAMKPFYVENYVFYYVSMMFFILSLFSLFGAALFKYVIYQEDKTIINKQYYTEKMYMPVDLLVGASSSEEQRLTAIKYSKSKGWHFLWQEKTDLADVYYEQYISKDGTPQEKLEIKSIPFQQDVEIEAENYNDDQ